MKKDMNNVRGNAEDQDEIRVVFNLFKVKHLTAVDEAKTSLVDYKDKDI